jgi:hypothetical protein
MSSFLRWFSRIPFAGQVSAGDARAVFDHVDAEGLPVGEFRASGSMHFDTAPRLDFADTLPSWSRSGITPRATQAAAR